jgi:hypothetical protein
MSQRPIDRETRVAAGRGAVVQPTAGVSSRQVPFFGRWFAEQSRCFRPRRLRRAFPQFPESRPKFRPPDIS